MRREISGIVTSASKTLTRITILSHLPPTNLVASYSLKADLIAWQGISVFVLTKLNNIRFAVYRAQRRTILNIKKSQEKDEQTRAGLCLHMQPENPGTLLSSWS